MQRAPLFSPRESLIPRFSNNSSRNISPPRLADYDAMKCANPDCVYEEITTTDPCIVCGRGVHHICSNELYDSGALSERFCSVSCLYQWKTVTSPPSASAESDTEAQEMPPSSSQTMLSSPPTSLFPLGQPTGSGSPSLSPACVVDLTVTSDASSISSTSYSTASGFDAFGIPLTFCHFRQQNSRHEVWEVAHRLEPPVTKTTGQDTGPFTHVCLLCAQQLTCNPCAAPNAWEGALHRWGNTSNARAHMVALHDDHPMGKAEAIIKLKAATRHVDNAMKRAQTGEYKRATTNTTNERAPKRRGVLQKLWVPTERDIGVYIVRWLISAGLPYNTVATEDFKMLVQRLTGNPDARILAASTFRDLPEVIYAKFCGLATELLLREFEAAHGFPFLNLHHDGWTTGNGKVSVMGASASFIDASWQPREIALLLTVGHSSHVSSDVQKMICTRIEEVFGIDINTMAQFTVSDTASSARKTSKLFEDSIPTDCTMHILNLCLQYGMGMRENKETVEVYDPMMNTRKREQRYCIVGGGFQEGRDLIRRIRALNNYFSNYFSTQQRCKRLEDVQKLFCLPSMGTTLDCDTRVAFTVKLFPETIVNYSAFAFYFQKPEKGDDASVFECLSAAEWRLVAEMEAIACSFADLARIEVQRSGLVASELIVLLKFAADRLNGNMFSVCDFDARRNTTTTVKSFPRYAVPVDELSPLAHTRLARMKGQVEQRIAATTAETAMILLLDPRTKFSVDSLIRPSNRGSDEEGKDDEAAEGDEADDTTERIVAAGDKLLVDAHREVFCAMNASAAGSAQNAATIASPNLDLVPCGDDEKVIYGAAIPMTAPETTPLSILHHAADKILQEWLQYMVDWVAVALHQTADKMKTKDDLTRLLMVRRGDVICYRVDALCEYVDILRWFRESGSAQFPSIAALTCVWLGRAPSNAFQERVFSTGGIVMSSLRTSTDNHRAEMQVVLKHNRKEIQRVEAGSTGGATRQDHI